MKSFVKKYGNWALVTGASKGIGHEIAQQLAAGGMNIVLVARQTDLLEQAAKDLERMHGVDTRVMAEDLTQPDAVSRIEMAVDDLDIGVLVPNAGIEINGEFIYTDSVKQHEQINVNVLAPTQMAHHFGKRMADRGKGAILFVSSLFAYQGIPYFSSYAASKSYILILGESLHVELKQHGVDVTVLSPGLTKTDMTAKIPIRWSRLPMIPHTPGKVARVGLKSIGKKPSVVPGLLNKIYAWENRFMTRIMPTKLFGFLIRKAFNPGVLKKQSDSGS